jgi:hypothetical protein
MKTREEKYCVCWDFDRIFSTFFSRVLKSPWGAQFSGSEQYSIQYIYAVVGKLLLKSNSVMLLLLLVKVTSYL